MHIVWPNIPRLPTMATVVVRNVPEDRAKRI